MQRSVATGRVFRWFGGAMNNEHGRIPSPQHRMRRRIGRMAGTVGLLASVCLAVTSCASSQVAVPAGPPASAAPSGSPSHGSTAKSSPSATKTFSPDAKPSARQTHTTAPKKTSSPSASGRTSTEPETVQKPAPKIRPKGNIRQHATTHKVTYESKAALGSTGRFAGGVRVRISKITPVTSKPVGPGEVGGAGLALTVKITNGSTVPVDLSTFTVTLSGSDGSPAIVTTGGSSAPLDGQLAAGDSANGTYDFTLANSLRRPVTIQVQYGNGQTVLQFSGNAR